MPVTNMTLAEFAHAVEESVAEAGGQVVRLDITVRPFRELDGWVLWWRDDAPIPDKAYVTHRISPAGHIISGHYEMGNDEALEDFWQRAGRGW